MGLTKPKKIVQSGVTLPTLSNPATAADIMKDKQAINQSGAVLTGNHVCKTLIELLPDMSNPATADQILSGYQGVNDKGELVTGTLEAVVNPVIIYSDPYDWYNKEFAFDLPNHTSGSVYITTFEEQYDSELSFLEIGVVKNNTYSVIAMFQGGNAITTNAGITSSVTVSGSTLSVKLKTTKQHAYTIIKIC